MKNRYLIDIINQFHLNNNFINILDLFDYNEMALSRIVKTANAFNTDYDSNNDFHLEKLELGRELLSKTFLESDSYDHYIKSIKDHTYHEWIVQDGKFDDSLLVTHRGYDLYLANRLIATASKGDSVSRLLSDNEIISLFAREYKNKDNYKKDLLLIASSNTIHKLNALYKVATNNNSINSNYHDSDMELIFNSTNNLAIRILSYLACDRDFIKEENHEEKMYNISTILNKFNLENLDILEKRMIKELNKNNDIDINYFVKLIIKNVEKINNNSIENKIWYDNVFEISFDDYCKLGDEERFNLLDKGIKIEDDIIWIGGTAYKGVSYLEDKEDYINYLENLRKCKLEVERDRPKSKKKSIFDIFRKRGNDNDRT